MSKDQRPWTIAAGSWNLCMKVFPTWLIERQGIVVYQNQVMDSSHLGDKSFMPARFIAEEDDQMHDAPDEFFPDGGGLPSLRQQKVDHITIEEFDGDAEALIEACFVKGD